MDNNKINTINVLKDSSIGTVEEYINFLLSAEKSSENYNPKNPDYPLADAVFQDILKKPATDLNLSAFLLTLHKKNPEASIYYLSLFKKYSITPQKEDQGNIFTIVEKLLDEANLIINPANEVDKYFDGMNYAFAVGIKCEDFYKYIPDQSLQELLQQTIRRRIAFLMTLIQMRSEKFGLLKDIYINDSIYSREISLCVLFHTLESVLDPHEKLPIEIYREVKKLVLKDVKEGRLQLPDRRLFKLKNNKKKKLLQSEFETLFLNEDDYSKNSILRIVSAYIDNYKKISEQIFPVIAVKDPVTGKIIRIKLSRNGPIAEEIEEVELPKISILNNDVEEYIRRQMAKKLADNSQASIETIASEVLAEKKLDSESTINSVVDITRPSIYGVRSWNRKLLFWMENFDEEKTVVGNLVMSAVSNSLLTSDTKEKIENVLNVKGTSLFITLAGFALGGLPGAIVLGAGTGVFTYISKQESFEEIFSKAFLNNLKGYSKKDMSFLAMNGHNPYLNLLKLIVENNQNTLKEYKNIFEKTDTRSANFKRINIFGINLSLKTQFAIKSAWDLVTLFGVRVGIQGNKSASILRRSRENLEFIKSLTLSGYTFVKRQEAFDILDLISKNIFIFGYKKSLMGSLMIKELVQSSIKTKNFIKLGTLIAPKYTKIQGNSFLYSWTGRTIQKVGYRLWDNIGLATQRNGPAFVGNIIETIGNFTRNLTFGLLSLGANGLNRATFFLSAMIIGMMVLVLFMMMQFSPILVANQEANTNRNINTGSVQAPANTPAGPFNIILALKQFTPNTPPQKVNVSYTLTISANSSFIFQGIGTSASWQPSFTPNGFVTAFSIDSKINANNLYQNKRSDIAGFLDKNELMAQAQSPVPSQSVQFPKTIDNVSPNLNYNDGFSKDLAYDYQTYQQKIGTEGFCASVTMNYSENNASKTQSSNTICIDKDGKLILNSTDFSCPLHGTISCVQGPNGTYSHAKLGTHAIDISNSTDVAYALIDGDVYYSGPVCRAGYWGGDMVILKGSDGLSYEYGHIDTYSTVVGGMRPINPVHVNKGDPIGKLYNNPGQDDGCWGGMHVHIQVRNGGIPWSPQYYLNSLEESNKWGCDWPLKNSQGKNMCTTGN